MMPFASSSQLPFIGEDRYNCLKPTEEASIVLICREIANRSDHENPVV